MFNIELRDFGPVLEGNVDIRPLTILVGPNNTGKSYVARLVYATLSPLGRPRRTLRARFLRAPQLYHHLPPSAKPSAEARKWLADKSKEGARINLDEMPREFIVGIEKAIKEFSGELVGGLAKEIERCFGTRLSEVARTSSTEGLRLCISQKDPPFTLELTGKGRSLQAVRSEFPLPKMEIDLKEERRHYPLSMFTDSLRGRVLRKTFESFIRTTYYFPAARSGILQGHKLLASVWLSRLPLIGIEPFEIPKLSGEVADFIGNILRMEKRTEKSPITSIAKFLENEVCRGRVDFRASQEKVEFPEMFYKSDEGRFPLHRTSSMISEIAPVVVFLKHIVQQGDILIIEEPEAHLHPWNQRIFARAIVRLIRNNVHVILTTHSDYFLNQISNFLRMAGIEDERLRLGYERDEFLRAEEVAAYLFCLKDNCPGSVIKPLSVTEDEGIPESDLLRVAEAIYKETVILQRVRSER